MNPADANQANQLKEALGLAIATRFKSNTCIACGTGSTVDTCFPHIKKALATGTLKDLSIMATSVETEERAKDAGCRIISVDNECNFDWGFDGADVVLIPEQKLKTGQRYSVIKGGGGAHYRERLVADQLLLQGKPYIIIADYTKVVSNDLAQANFAVPVEIEKSAKRYVTNFLKNALGAVTVTERPREKAKYGRDCFDIRGNLILDATFSSIQMGLSDQINGITGVLTCGLFENYASEILIAEPDGSISSHLASA
jgi:ribose 5-phosphate isomerase